MELKFYYSFIEFKNDFEDNFKKWQEEYPNGDLGDFKQEYLKEYEDFYKIDEVSGGVYFCLGNFCNEMEFINLLESYKNTDEQYLELDIFLDKINNNEIVIEKLYAEEIYIAEYDRYDIIEHSTLIDKKIIQKIAPLLIDVFDYGISLNDSKYRDFQYSVVGIVNFLMQKETTEQMQETQQIKSNITQTELVELVKALKESNVIDGTQKDLINTFAVFFGVTINNPNKLLQDIKKRNNGSETLFLDKLKEGLLDFINK
ncbi:MAG: RteC domain-containing protein [Flavobacteriaceae bacterium]|nr:RteC domain-containing protein [Flavobacteriaceae bacterium]